MDTITEEQRERLKAKAEWEHMTLSAVMIEWPEIIAPHTLPHERTVGDEIV